MAGRAIRDFAPQPWNQSSRSSWVNPTDRIEQINEILGAKFRAIQDIPRDAQEISIRVDCTLNFLSTAGASADYLGLRLVPGGTITSNLQKAANRALMRDWLESKKICLCPIKILLGHQAKIS